MNIATELPADPVRQMLADQFTGDPQVDTVIAMNDHFFGGVKARKPTDAEEIEAIIATANRIALMLAARIVKYPDDSNLAEAQGFAEGILLNAAGHREKINEVPEHVGQHKYCAECYHATHTIG